MSTAAVQQLADVLQAASEPVSCPVRYNVTGIIGNVVLMTAVFHLRKEFLRKLSAVWALASPECPPALFKAEILLKISVFKGPQTSGMPAAPALM